MDIKSITREEIIEKVNNKETEWFYEVYNECWRDKSIVEVLYDQNWGDGNDYQIAMLFKEHNLTVLLDGTYSSWDSPHWDSVDFAKPFTFKETRYRAATIAELREDKINDVLDKEG